MSSLSVLLQTGCCVVVIGVCVVKQKTAYEMRISDCISDVCSSDLQGHGDHQPLQESVTAHGGTPCWRWWPRLRVAANGRLGRSGRSEERRVGKGCVSTSRSRWCASH